MKLFRFGQTEPALFSDELEAALLAQFPAWSFDAFSSPAMHTEFRSDAQAERPRWEVLCGECVRPGFLGRYLPEIGRLDCLPQLDPCRKYTIDEQVFKSIDALDDMAASPGASMHDYQRVLDQVADASLVYLALLLRHGGFRLDPRHAPRHDAVAACALRRLNVESESQEKVLLMVREQRLLAEVSQRRDLDDPFILQEVCDAVETADNLNMLLLLTYVGLRPRLPTQQADQRRDVRRHGAAAGTRRTGEAGFTAVSFSWHSYVELGIYRDRLIGRVLNQDNRIADRMDAAPMSPLSSMPATTAVGTYRPTGPAQGDDDVSAARGAPAAPPKRAVVD